MALDQAVLGICDEMEKEADPGSKDGHRLNLKTYAKMLRMVVKAAEGESPKVRERIPTCARCHVPSKELAEDSRLCPVCQNDVKEREEREKRRSGAEEATSGKTVLILDGPLFDPTHSTSVQVPPDMPVNAFLPIQDYWYQLKVNGLRHSPQRDEEAKRLREQESGTPSTILLGKG